MAESGRCSENTVTHPLGTTKTPMCPDEPHLPIDYVEPLYCTFTHVTTDVNNVKINTYELVIE